MNVHLIRESFDALKPHAIEVVEHFYVELFERYPQSKGLFKQVNMVQQQRALANSLAHIVEFIEDGEHLTDYLRKMGKRHVAYGTLPEHFEWVGAALLATLEYYFGTQWSPELAQSWKAAFGLIEKEMLTGMQSEMGRVFEMKKEDPKPSLQELAKKIAYEMLKNSIDGGLTNEAFQQAVRERIQDILLKAIEAETLQMLSETRSIARTA